MPPLRASGSSRRTPATSRTRSSSTAPAPSPSWWHRRMAPGPRASRAPSGVPRGLGQTPGPGGPWGAP
eukprot:14242859-Alexandrium_andersonii.AAC.1